MKEKKYNTIIDKIYHQIQRIPQNDINYLTISSWIRNELSYQSMNNNRVNSYYYWYLFDLDFERYITK